MHVDALKFCFMSVIHAVLDRVLKKWNIHIITNKRNAEGPNGKPDFIYFSPEYYGTENYSTSAETEEVEACRELYGINTELTFPYTPQFLELVDELLPDARLPTNQTEALELFLQLTNLSDDI